MVLFSGALGRGGTCDGKEQQTSQDLYTPFQTQPQVKVTDPLGLPVANVVVSVLYVPETTTVITMEGFRGLIHGSESRKERLRGAALADPSPHDAETVLGVRLSTRTHPLYPCALQYLGIALHTFFATRFNAAVFGHFCPRLLCREVCSFPM